MSGKKNGNGDMIIALAAVGAAAAVYLYCNQPKSALPKPQYPVNHVVLVKSVPNTVPVRDGINHLEDFAFSDIKNTYVNGGHSDLLLATDATSENIGGILTNTKDAKGQVINVGMNLMNEFAMGQRDDRVIEGYYMNEHPYGAGTPNYRKLKGWY